MNDLPQGEVVVTAMGGMGREWDGGYAEFTCAPAKQFQASPQPCAAGTGLHDYASNSKLSGLNCNTSR